MRISADCIDEEHEYTNERLLSETFSRMALNDCNQNNNQTLNGQQVRVIYRFCSPPEDYDIQRDGFIPLTIIPIVDNNFDDGYYSNWDEVKNQILSLNFKDRNQIPKTIGFVGKIGSGNCELPLITKEDYFTALKVAELCGQPLDVLIKTSLQDYNGIKESDVTKASCSKTITQNDETVNQSISDSDNDINDDKNGFVVLTDTPNVDEETANNGADKTQMSPQNDNIVLSKCQIENLKKEITIDVTKRIISKLSECLTELNIEEDSRSDSAIQTNSNADFVNNNDNDSNSSSDEKSSQVIHYGIICDNCETQIKGIRYKCSVCLDYDLCEKCERLADIHNEDHSFLKIKQYIKPFKMPNSGEDIFLALDVDLPTGKINIGDLKVVSKPKTVRSTSSTTQTAEQSCGAVNAEQTTTFSSSNSKASLNGSRLESNATTGSQSHTMAHAVSKVKMSDKKAIKIAKKLEKLKIKGQIYSNLLQSSDERSARYESKSSASGVHSQHQPLTGNKTLFLSGLFVGDETIPEGTQMPPSTKFRKTWRIRNTGTKVWTGRTTLRYVWGHSELEPFGKVIEVQAPQLRPGEEGKVAIRFQAPKSSGVYQSHWRLHHRGQPFGQRLICKVVIDPKVSGITQPVVTGMKATELMSPIVEQKAITTTLSNARFQAQEKPAVNPIRHKIQGASKHLHEALTAVKEIRFSLENNESIPMKANVKSHTTTPANTPFDVSPPKSPEPSLSNSLTQLESNENNGTNSNEDKNGDNLVEDKSNDAEEVLSLSGSEASDDFVLVPLPRCFDLNVPFCGTDNTAAQVDCVRDDNGLENDVKNSNCFEEIYEQNKNEFIQQNNNTIDPFDENSPNFDDLNDFSEYMVSDEVKDMNIAIDLSTNKIETNEQNENQASAQVFEAEVETTKASAPQNENESQNKQKPVSPSTNPFRDSCNETENVIHVLPESIVTGALSAAAHVYNNVSRALFPRNEGNSDSRHFAWITSPPPAAIPLPERYWDPPRAHQYQPQEYFSTTCASTNSTLTTTSKNAGIVTTTSAPSSVMTNTATAEPQRNRLSDALTQLYEMGFWNQKLNQELLEKNKYDVNDTIEDLLSPERGRQRRNGGSDEVVSRQPTHNRNDFIEEFD